MKKLITLVLLALCLPTLACMGGIYNVNDKITLYGGTLVVNGDTHEAEVEKEFEAGGAKIKVLYRKGDAGGTMFTIYSVKKGEESYNVKVKTNYLGNGVRTRGLEFGVPKADKTVGCGSH